jgi:hypothetical protein
MIVARLVVLVLLETRSAGLPPPLFLPTSESLSIFLLSGLDDRLTAINHPRVIRAQAHCSLWKIETKAKKHSVTPACAHCCPGKMFAIRTTCCISS